MKKWIKQITLNFLLVGFTVFASAEGRLFEVDPGHSTIAFGIRHLVTTVNGRFTDYSGTISYDEKVPARSKVNFVVKTASLTTENAMRDKDLRSANFFDVETYPEAKFLSTQITMLGKKKAKIKGNLTIRGITRGVVFDVDYLGKEKDPMGSLRTGFTAETTLSRKDYGLTWNKVLDSGGLLIGDEVKLKIDVEAIAR